MFGHGDGEAATAPFGPAFGVDFDVVEALGDEFAGSGVDEAAGGAVAVEDDGAGGFEFLKGLFGKGVELVGGKVAGILDVAVGVVLRLADIEVESAGGVEEAEGVGEGDGLKGDGGFGFFGGLRGGAEEVWEVELVLGEEDGEA